MQLPESGVEIVTAVKGKPCKVNKQIMLSIRIQIKIIDLKLIVVKNLRSKIIRRSDILYEFKAKISMGGGEYINMYVEKEEIMIKFESKELINQEQRQKFTRESVYFKNNVKGVTMNKANQIQPEGIITNTVQKGLLCETKAQQTLKVVGGGVREKVDNYTK